MVRIKIAVSREVGIRACTPARSASLSILKPTIMPSKICSTYLAQEGIRSCGTSENAPSMLTAPTANRVAMRTPAAPKSKTAMIVMARLIHAPPTVRKYP